MRYATATLVAVIALVGCGSDVSRTDQSAYPSDEMPANLRGESFMYMVPGGDKVPCVLFSSNSSYVSVVCDWSRMYR